MQIAERIEGEVLVLVVKERRVDARSAPELKDALADYVSKGHERIVLDLADVEFMDSSGLGAMVSGLKLLANRGELVLARVRDSVHALLRLTRMDQVFRTFPTVDGAQRAIASHA